jgi:molybdopterin/thiamine biosynthesis adenylyltransferase
MVIAVSNESGPVLPFGDRLRTHFLTRGDGKTIGRWFQVDEAVNISWVHAATRRAALSTPALRAQISTGFVLPQSGHYFALTFASDLSDRAREAGIPAVAGWLVDTEAAHPVSASVESDQLGVAQLVPLWPADILQTKTATVVGTGSIGSAAANALAAAGIGTLNLVDHDRLLSHNLIRHTSSPKHVGKKKVDALKIEIESLRPDTRVNAHPIDVISDANYMRNLLQSADIVLCATDGIASRRTTGHLARRAGKTAILACVLEGGSLGEVMRLRPWTDHGCITCRREDLREKGSIDPEPALNLPYGEGTRHRPMTAVGIDLHLVGQYAAKNTVATLLEAEGLPDQRLPGEHMLLALRPAPGWPAPFDVDRAGEVRWLPATTPKPGCPTCQKP